MRKVIVGAMVSIDGVMQAPGGPTEDPTKGFKFGGWVMPYFDQEFGEELDHLFNEKFDLLLGRKTGNTWFRAPVRSIRVGRARCFFATSPR